MAKNPTFVEALEDRLTAGGFVEGAHLFADQLQELIVDEIVDIGGDSRERFIARLALLGRAYEFIDKNVNMPCEGQTVDPFLCSFLSLVAEKTTFIESSDVERPSKDPAVFAEMLRATIQTDLTVPIIGEAPSDQAPILARSRLAAAFLDLTARGAFMEEQELKLQAFLTLVAEKTVFSSLTTIGGQASA